MSINTLHKGDEDDDNNNNNITSESKSQKYVYFLLFINLMPHVRNMTQCSEIDMKIVYINVLKLRSILRSCLMTPLRFALPNISVSQN